MSCKGKAVRAADSNTEFFLVLKEKVQNLGTWVLGREGRQGPNRLFFSSESTRQGHLFKSTLNIFYNICK